MTHDERHQPVMLQESLAGLQVKAGEWYLDATFGRGGHTEALIQLAARVLAFDVDHQALAFGEKYFAQAIAAQKLVLKRVNFEKLQSEVQELQSQQTVGSLAGILFDLGTSSHQLLDPERGFSFRSQAPLDMRMDDRLGVTAADLLKVLPTKQLAQLFKEQGGEEAATQIARRIDLARKAGQTPTTTQELAELIIKTKSSRHQSQLHPATKVFQALRIAVNSELTALEQALPQAREVLMPGGRIVAISFHEGEDRLVKHAFRSWDHLQLGTSITKKPLVPSQVEETTNPRARSAKLRIWEKAK